MKLAIVFEINAYLGMMIKKESKFVCDRLPDGIAGASIVRQQCDADDVPP